MVPAPLSLKPSSLLLLFPLHYHLYNFALSTHTLLWARAPCLGASARPKFSSVQLLSCVQLFATHGLQHSRPPCPSPTPRIYSNSCPLSQWCHSTISSSVIPFSSHLQSFPPSGSFPVSQFFELGGQSIGVSASISVLQMNIWTDFL